MPRPYSGGQHELGQNFLVDQHIIRKVTNLIASTEGPIVEIGAGDGAITLPLTTLGRALTAVELDPQKVRQLKRKTPNNVRIFAKDIAHFQFPSWPHVVVGNLPFHLTTMILRKLLVAQHWQTAVLLVQWEVARRRAGIGGSTMMTAQWAPWYEFALHGRVPARAFRPVPSVDGGLLVINRRAHPLVSDQQGYQRFVKDIFTGSGRGIREILIRATHSSPRLIDRWLASHDIPAQALPKSLTAEQWSSLWNLRCR